MALEDAIAALTAAVEKNTAALLGQAADSEPAPARGKGKPRRAETTAVEETGPSLEDVRAALFLVRDKVGRADAKKIINGVGGVEALDLIPPAKFAAVLAACEKALNAKEKGGDDSDDL